MGLLFRVLIPCRFGQQLGVRDVFGNQVSNPNERVVAISDVGTAPISKLEF